MWHRMRGRSKCFVAGHMLGQAAEYWMATLGAPQNPAHRCSAEWNAHVRKGVHGTTIVSQCTDLGISCCCFEIQTSSAAISMGG
ncbi:Hypothetical protein GSB_150323 [Giardia duodenalis]|uniref:Uncharacterized protein n=1 Tax=Giardia intestinalis TaxID=5741 RepID=V6U3B0_GIAIN|nr:Hypothetical protein GSB_150323 [Giardia intestinalis]